MLMDYLKDICSGDDIYTEIYEEKFPEKLDKKEEKELKDINELTPLEIKWNYFILFLATHIMGWYGLYLCFTETKWQTMVFSVIIDILCMISIMGGAHRLWSHRSYKAKLPLRLFYAFFFTMASQESLFSWVLNHRVHHKFADTNADPHNARRGVWYSHIWWIATKRTEDFRRKAKTIDMSDLKADPIIRFQYKYLFPLVILISIVLPFAIPVYFWGETIRSASFVPVSWRLQMTFHQTFLINSLAHKIGYRPYDTKILPTENSCVSIFAFGEGFHNFHHSFPWDYSASEFGFKLNVTTFFIDLMAMLGLATNRKTASKSLVETRKRKTEEESMKDLKSMD